MNCKTCDSTIWSESKRSREQMLCKSCLRQLRYLEFLRYLANEIEKHGQVRVNARLSLFPARGLGSKTHQLVTMELYPDSFEFLSPPKHFEELNKKVKWSEVQYVGGKTYNPMKANREYVENLDGSPAIGVVPLPQDQTPFLNEYLTDLDIQYVFTLNTFEGLKDFWINLILDEQEDEPSLGTVESREFYGSLYVPEMHEIFGKFLEENSPVATGDDEDRDEISMASSIAYGLLGNALTLETMSPKALHWGLGRWPVGRKYLLTHYF